MVMGVASAASAEPLRWRAPDGCPSADDETARIERRRGESIAAGTTVWKDVEAGTLVLNDKTQTSKTGYVRPVKKKS